MGSLIKYLTAAALLVAALITFTGCPGGNGGVGPTPPPDRDFGPPFEEVVFPDGSWFLATVISTTGGTPLYVPGIGIDESVSDMAYGYKIAPNSTVNTVDFAVYDRTFQQLFVIDENGNNTGTFTPSDAIEGMFTFSSGGSRIIYVDNTGSGQRLIIEGLEGQEYTVATTLGLGNNFVTRPTVNNEPLGGMRIGMVVRVPGGSTVIRLYSREGEVPLSLSIPAQALRYSPNGDWLAYIEAAPGNNSGSELVILNQATLGEHLRVQFDSYGEGATSFAWSPNSNQIALFAGSSGAIGNLIVINTSTGLIMEVPHDGTYVFPTDNLDWAQPSWNPTGTELVFTIRDETGQYDVVRTDLNGTTVPLYEGVGGPRYVSWIGAE